MQSADSTSRDTEIDTSSASGERPSSGDPTVAAAASAVWPRRLPQRDIAGLPPAALQALPSAPHRAAVARAAASLDRSLPGWPERAAALLVAAVEGPFTEEHQRLAGLLAHRPLRHPDDLVRAAGSASDPAVRLWLLAALSGTDTSALRSFWLYDLRDRVRSEPESPDPALWFGFLRAFSAGWLTYSDFRDALCGACILTAADPGGDYPRWLSRLGLADDPTFTKWYRQAVYEIAHQPDVSLSYRAAGWIRDFPGEDYLWQAIDSLSSKPDSWWHLSLLTWASGVDSDQDRFLSRLGDCSDIALALLSLLRPDLCGAVGRLRSLADHEAALEWLKGCPPSQPLDLRWIDARLRPWTQAFGRSITLAAGALCSVDPPDDFPGPEDPVLRRRDFIRSHLLPEFDRVMDNLTCLHALRREHFEVICQTARRGRPAAIRALSLWPERAEAAAPILFGLSRTGHTPARRAAREALETLRARAGVGDLSNFERRLDLAAAWSDAGLEGKPSRVWWDVAGYRLKLSVAAGQVSLDVYSGRRRLASIPKAVRENDEYPEIRRLRADLARSYRYFRRRFEDAMVEGAVYPGRDFATLLANPVVRSLISRLVLLTDGKPFLWTADDPMAAAHVPAEIESAGEVAIAHPLHLGRRGLLAEWQLAIIESRVSQPFKQLFRECYHASERDLEADACLRFEGNPLIARRAFALLRSRGYSPRRGDAVKDYPDAETVAHIQWAGEGEEAGRLLALTKTDETVTSGPVWFSGARGDRLQLGAVSPTIFSETLRDADLLVSGAAAGELGFTSEETLRLRATLARYLTRALDLTTVYISEDSRHALVDGHRALYRLHLGSGSVLLEESRRSLDTSSIADQPLHQLVAESVDSVTARILGLIGALAHDDQITEPEFLAQLPS